MKRSLFFAAAVLVLAVSVTSLASQTATATATKEGTQCRVPDPQRAGQLMVNCPGFTRRAVSVSKVEGDQVWLRYNLEGVPCGANYVVRFWPMGRHEGPYMDFEIGDLPENGKKSDVVGPWRVPGITARKQYQYNIDLDVWKDGEAYSARSADGFLGQCDRGGTITLEPPAPTPTPTPPPPTATTTTAGPPTCECHVTMREGSTPDEVRYDFKTVCEGDPAYGTHPRRTMVEPGRCKPR